MKKIGFYIENSRFTNIDCGDVVSGNPGIGGTEFLFILVSSQLAIRNNDIEVIAYVESDSCNLPHGLRTEIVLDQIDAIRKADKEELDYLVLNNAHTEWKNINYSDLKSDIKFIAWCHNFCPIKKLDYLATNARIYKIINVGREQMDLYRDHPSFGKMEYIYNCVPFNLNYCKKARENKYENRAHIVTYMASLVSGKSFHVLAKIWTKILKEVPDAQLYIIGSGSVYNSRAKLGKYGIASEDYEKIFMPYLTDKQGNILPSVHFMGKLGEEKNELLLNTKVGVPNPLGTTETFCLSAVEMQAMGCYVVGMKVPGYLDTFLHGRVVNSKNQLYKAIVTALLATSEKRKYDDYMADAIGQFSIDTVINDWEHLICNVSRVHPILPLRNKYYRLKVVKEYIRIHPILRYCYMPFSCLERVLIYFDHITRKYYL